LRINFNTFCAFIFLTFKFLNAQELPPIFNFSPDSYRAENQNWSIDQAESGYIYVANNSGLLEYDGAKWRVYSSPNRTIIRSVKVVSDRIYTGSYMQFGYWQSDSSGKLTYNSLSDNLELPLQEDEQFWNILPLDRWVLFQSLNRIYIYDTRSKTFEIIYSDATISKSVVVGGKIYFQSIGEGLFTILNGKKDLISNASVFKNKLLVTLFKSETDLVAVTQNSGFFTIQDGITEPLVLPASPELSEKTIYSAKQLKDKSLIVGTISDGVYHLTSNGTIQYHINQDAGLFNNTVLSINEDRDSNVWLGLDRGIALINNNSPYAVYKDNSGDIGAVYCAAVKDSLLYLGTNQGLFYRPLNNTNQPFTLIPNTKGQVWFLDILGNDLLCGHHEGTFLVKGNQVKSVSEIQGVWKIMWLDAKRGLALQGNYSGLYILENKNDYWTVRNKIDGFDISSRYFGFINPNTLYINHEYKGVFRLKIDTNYQKVVEQRLVKDLGKGEKSGILNYDGKLLYTSENGIFKLDSAKKIFEREETLSLGSYKNGNYLSGKLTYDEPHKKLWGFNTEEIYYIEPGAVGIEPKITHISFPSTKRQDVTGFENITFLENNRYLIGNSSGYTILNLDKKEPSNYDVTIRSIQNGSLDKELRLVELDKDQVFNYKENNLIIDYSVATYDIFKTVNYQYRLSGLYEQWSSWSTKSQVAFENLPSGNYTFEVRARIGDELIDNTANFVFTVKRPWYLSVLMLVIYLILLLALFVAIHFFNRRYYKKQKERLIEINTRKIELSKYESERKIMQLENEKLLQDVESKNRELAASTMSIVKKNELLNTIKKELLASDNEEESKSVIKILDKNLNPKKDWELFSQAFNNTDKDFLKKIKSKHLKLTPNDLKLCAYLRLNLSSKEIAPLLNISVRSVEIKRYRLRKKLNLEHEDGLVEYILSI